MLFDLLSFQWTRPTCRRARLAGRTATSISTCTMLTATCCRTASIAADPCQFPGFDFNIGGDPVRSVSLQRHGQAAQVSVERFEGPAPTRVKWVQFSLGIEAGAPLEDTPGAPRSSATPTPRAPRPWAPPPGTARRSGQPAVRRRLRVCVPDRLLVGRRHAGDVRRGRHPAPPAGVSREARGDRPRWRQHDVLLLRSGASRWTVSLMAGRTSSARRPPPRTLPASRC